MTGQSSFCLLTTYCVPSARLALHFILQQCCGGRGTSLIRQVKKPSLGNR